jgi:predicted HicB family RNase H-like nuclease
MENLENKLKNIEEVEPDSLDLLMIQESSKANYETNMSLADFKRTLKNHTGKLSVRLPKSLHKQLKDQAQVEGISLNQYVLYKLAK